MPRPPQPPAPIALGSRAKRLASAAVECDVLAEKLRADADCLVRAAQLLRGAAAEAEAGVGSRPVPPVTLPRGGW